MTHIRESTALASRTCCQNPVKMALSMTKFAGARVAVRKAAAPVRPATRMSCMAFKVTLKMPTGEKTIEVSPDTYILDAAEVRAVDCQGGAEPRGLVCSHD